MTKKLSGHIISYFLAWALVFVFLSNAIVVACGNTDCYDNTASVLPERMYKEECKEIIAMNPATAGEYNLHMKTRDPSRHGVQVLFICEPGYEYTYHHPQTGEPMDFTVNHRVIGTTSINDKPPQIMKPGNILTDAGISYGTNDCPALMHINPTQYAWDDFDWVRYAYQTADTEDEAVDLLTKGAVDDLHATGIGEILYVVGPKKGYAVEADAYHYHVEEVKDVFVRSNYPEYLWEGCSSDQYKYAPTLETKFDDWVREFQIIKLGVKCTLGVTIRSIGNDHIIVKALPGDGEEVTINKGENKTLGNFYISLKAISGFGETRQQQKQAHITICFKYLEWRERMYDIINGRKGDITVADIMNWSRLHSDDLDYLRGLCEGGEGEEEAVNIFRHPLKEPELMSSLWFSGIPCSSIYVPVHICAKDIYGPYKSGAAWEITFDLLKEYGHGVLPPILCRIEKIIIAETDEIEKIGLRLLKSENETKTIDLLTFSDTMLQCHGFKMAKILLNLSQLKDESANKEVEKILEAIDNMWSVDYVTSMRRMKNVVQEINGLSKNPGSINKNVISLLEGIKGDILDIMQTAAWYKLNEALCVVSDKDSDWKESKKIYLDGIADVEKKQVSSAAEKFLQSYEIANCLVLGIEYRTDEGDQIWSNNTYVIVSGIIILVIIICAVVNYRKRRYRDY